MKLNQKEGKGITMIALVITVIILLILAGISISTLTGDNGILTRAKYAKEKTKQTELQEQQDLEDFKKELEDVIAGETADKVEDTTPGELAGGGTTEEPFKIESVEDLVTFMNRITDGETFEGKVVELTKTLDLESANSYIDANTTAFGDYNGDGVTKGLKDEITDTSATGFKFTTGTYIGTLEGNNNSINNIYSNIKIKSGLNYYGFISLQSGIIQNLTLAGNIYLSESRSHVRVGGIVGKNKGTIYNCTNKINIEVSNLNLEQKEEANSLQVGGITGTNENDDEAIAVINQCRNEGNINVTRSNNITDATFYDTIRIGGIAGRNNQKVINVTNIGDVIVSYTKLGCENATTPKIAGICGDIDAGACINNAVNEGKVSVISNDKLQVGGIVADCSTTTVGIIKNVLNKGIVEGEAPENMLEIGGIVGDGYANVDRAYNLGQINAKSTTKYIGAIIGDTHTETVTTNCKFLEGTAPGAAQGIDNEGIEKLTSLTQEEVVTLLNQGVQELNSTENVYKEWQINGSNIVLK